MAVARASDPSILSRLGGKQIMAEPNHDDGVPRTIKTAHALVAVAAAVVTAWGAWATVKIDQISADLDRAREERLWAEKIVDKFYDSVTRAGLSETQRLTSLSGLLTLTELIDPTQAELKKNLAKAIRDQADTYRKQLEAAGSLQTGAQRLETQALAAAAGEIGDLAAAKTRAFTVAAELAAEGGPTSSAASASGAGWGSYDFDIFWCETSPGAEQAANAVAALKGVDPLASGRWRVRMLSAETNRRSGYRISGYLIRASTDEEEPLANALKNEIAARGTAGANSRQFSVERVPYASPYYISTFVCP